MTKLTIMKKLITICLAFVLGISGFSVMAQGFWFSVGDGGVSMAVSTYPAPPMPRHHHHHHYGPRHFRGCYERPRHYRHYRGYDKAAHKYYKKQHKLYKKYRKESRKNFVKYQRARYRHHDWDD